MKVKAKITSQTLNIKIPATAAQTAASDPGAFSSAFGMGFD